MSKELDPCPPGLFDRIILTIKKEQELRQSRRLLFLCISMLGVSLSFLPFSATYFFTEWRASGSFYFISSALENISIFSAHWQEFMISIFEVLPVAAIIALAVNVVIALFAIKLFFHRDGLLIKYIKHNLILHHG